MHAGPSRRGFRALFAAPAFLRLWSIGGCVNAMRWFEVLAAALFTLDTTGSGLAVALVTAARTMPMFLLGAFAGVMAEAVNRKHVLVIGQVVTAMASASVALLAWGGVARPWHVACAALVSGTVWSTEMATRRRMVGECVEGALVPRALAFDTVTNSVTRMGGPVAAGVLYQIAGLGGAFSVSAAIYLLAALLAAGLKYRQATHRLVFTQVPRDLAEGFTFARGHSVIAGVLLVTMAMNLLGFPYSALIVPIGRQHFLLSPTLVGVLAAAEAFGALIGGLRLASGDPPGSGRVLMVGGSLLFLCCVALMPLAPGFVLAFALLATGGIGSAAFANMQTSLIIMHAPPHVRSRLMGLLTVGIGMGPLGILLIGALASVLGPLHAVDAMALSGLVAVSGIGVLWRRNERTAARAAPRIAARQETPPPVAGGGA
jgi:MFS family permease